MTEQKNHQVLIIDDDELYCEITKFQLQHKGAYDVLIAHSAKPGLHMAKKHKPDVILLDINLPHSSGFDILSDLKSDLSTCSIPVIMVSGLDDHETMIKAAQNFSEAYLTKPVPTEELLKTVSVVCAGTKIRPSD